MSDVEEIERQFAALDKYERPAVTAITFTDHKSFQEALLDDETITEGSYPGDYLTQAQVADIHAKHLAGTLEPVPGHLLDYAHRSGELLTEERRLEDERKAAIASGDTVRSKALRRAIQRSRRKQDELRADYMRSLGYDDDAAQAVWKDRELRLSVRPGERAHHSGGNLTFDTIGTRVHDR